MDTIANKIINELKAKRTELSKSLNIEPFKILRNETIQLIAQSKSQTKEELLLIKGIGPKSFQRFGSEVIRIVKMAMEENQDRKEEIVFSVAEFINYLNNILVQQKAVVKGEIYGKVNRRGQANYFVLKDKKEEAILSCFAWQEVLDRVGVDLREGMEIKIVGKPRIYSPRGQLSFEAEEILLTGEGALKKAFEELKKKLQIEGLFEPVYKQKLPRFVKNIGLITAANREAQKDFLTHLGKWDLRVYSYDVRVEGVKAMEQIIGAITWFNKYRPDIEVLVLTRGGGGLESLQAFNSEAVARAIFASKIPIVCGIGHERDITIADLVADVRASTPTDAGRILGQDWEKAPEYLIRQAKSFRDNLLMIIEQSNSKLTQQEIYFNNFLEKVISNYNSKLNEIISSINKEVKQCLISKTSLITEAEKKLSLVNPTLKLKQGYSIVFDEFKKSVIKSVDQLKVDDKINIKLYKGRAGAQIKKIILAYGKRKKV